MSEDNESNIPKEGKEQKDERSNEKPLDINLVKITDDIIKGDPSNQEELKKKIRELKTKITQEMNTSSHKDIDNGLVELNLGLDGLNSTIAQILKIFQGKDWVKEFEKKISVEIPKLVESEIIKIQPSQSYAKKAGDNNLKNENKELRKANLNLESVKYDLTADMQKLEKDAKQVKHVLIALKDFSIDAIKDKSYDKAIEILQNTEEKLLPLIKDQGVLTEDDQKDLKSSVLKELKTALLQKGQIGKAIKIIDTQCSDPTCTFTDYFTAQINKSYLLARSGEFNKAITVLNKLLKKFYSLSPEYREIYELAEIKRALGIVYRSKGSFDEAIKWFNEAKEEYENIEDDIGIHNALWGMGILHYLRGEWEEAIQIWKKIQYFYENKKPSDDLYKSKTLFKLYFDFTRTLQLSGNFKEAETMLNKSLSILDEKKASSLTYSRAKVYLAFAELYYLQNKIADAHEYIKKVRNINSMLKSKGEETIPELDVLEIEIRVKCAQNKPDEAKNKLITQSEYFISNWEKAKYYRLLATIEKHEMNYGQAKKALKSSLEIIKDIGACPISDKLLYSELLIEMSRIGNKRAYEEATKNLIELEAEINEKRLPALNFEMKIQKGYLALVGASYDDAYKIFSDIVQEADKSRLYRQKSKALEAIASIETQGHLLSESAREKSVYRYLDDARRILEEYS